MSHTYHFVHTVDKLRREIVAYSIHHHILGLLAHVSIIALIRDQCFSTQIGRHDDDGVLEIDLASLACNNSVISIKFV